MVNQLAVFEPDLDAAICFYGMAPEPALVPQIKARVLLHYAGQDERINASRAAYEAAMKLPTSGSKVSCTKANNMPSTMTPTPHATTKPRRIWPGAERSRFFRKHSKA